VKIPWKCKLFRNYRRWRKASSPLLLNTKTGEVLPFSPFKKPPSGKWLLRQPISLPESSLPLFITVEVLFR
jgi:hypothetical protein